MTQPREPFFNSNEEKPIVAYLLATPQLLHGRFDQAYERILQALNAADPTKLTNSELETLGEKANIFFGESFTPTIHAKNKSKKKKRPSRAEKQENVAASTEDTSATENATSRTGQNVANGGEPIEELDYEQMQAGQMGNGSAPPRKLNRDLSIYVKGIDDTMTAEGLRDAFCAHGTVNAVDVVYDKKCAYIEFISKEDCDRAIEAHEIPVGNTKVYALPRVNYGTRGYRRHPRGGYHSRGGYNGTGDFSYRGGYVPRGGAYRGRGYQGGFRGNRRYRHRDNYGNGEFNQQNQTEQYAGNE